MDSADPDTVRVALRSQGSRILNQEERLTSVVQEIQGISSQQQGFQSSVCEQLQILGEQIQLLTLQMENRGAAAPAPTAAPVLIPAPQPAPPLASVPAPHLSSPARFSGDSGSCRSFLVQCGLHFELQASSFPTDRAKVAFIITHLSGRAEAWATAEWARESPVCNSLKDFKDTLSKIFDQTTPGREAARALMGLRQGRRRVADYAIEFRTLAVDSGWNPSALCDAFLHGLEDLLRDQLAPLELPEDLDFNLTLY